MKTSLRFLSVLLFLSLVIVEGKSQVPAPKQIEGWIEDLGSSEFSKRESAQKNLWKAGSIAEDYLKKALKRDDLEIRKRCQELLDKFKWGIYFDTPVSIVDLIQAYQSSQPDKKEETLGKLLGAGLPGVRAAIKVLQAEDQDLIRLPLVSFASKKLSLAVPALVEAKEFGLLHQFLMFLLECRAEEAHSHLAAFAVLTGNVKGEMEKANATPIGRLEKDYREIWKAYLLRAEGHLGKAAEIAKQAGDENLACNLYLENGDWATVLKGKALPDDLSPGKYGYRLALARLTGDEQEYQAACKDLESAEGKQENDPQLGKIALINGRKKEGMDLLKRAGKNQMILELLLAASQFDDAEKLIANSKELSSADLAILELTMARSCFSLGKKDEAVAIFAKYGGKLIEKAEGDWPFKLIQSYSQLKLKPQAFEAACKYLAFSEQRENAVRVLHALHGEGKEEFDPVFRYISKKSPSASPKENLAVIQKLVDKKMPREELGALVFEMIDYSKRVIPSEGEVLIKACASLLRTNGMGAQLEKLCQDANEEKCWLELGDFFASEKKWNSAKEAYGNSWKLNKVNPLPVFLASRMARSDNQKAEEEKWARLARWIPLGNAQIRSEFAFALAKRGFAEEAKQEFLLIQATGEPGSFPVGTAGRALAGYWISKNKFQQAANSYELALLRCMTPYVTFLQSQAYLGVPTITYRLRARDLAEKSDFKGCEKFIQKSQELFPADVDLPILVYNCLVAKGKKELADGVFSLPKSKLNDLCEKFPNCAWARNSAAWMSACCKRDLDWGLAHAQKAVQIDPESSAYHDTLAEIYFQLGRKKEALDEQKKAIALDPVKIYYRKQLKRIEKGDPTAEKPDENEDEE